MELRGNVYRATCLQCNEAYEDFVAAIGSRAGHYRKASRSNRNIWAASHCEKTRHVRFKIEDIDSFITILRAPTAAAPLKPLVDALDEDAQLRIEGDENFELMPGTWHPAFDAPQAPDDGKEGSER